MVALRGHLVPIVVMAVIVGLVATPCAGWQASAEERLACCANETECPMEAANADASAGHTTSLQSHADTCCALSDTSHSGLPAGHAVFDGSALLLLANLPSDVVAQMVPLARRSDTGSTAVHLYRPPLRLLLSIFLI